MAASLANTPAFRRLASTNVVARPTLCVTEATAANVIIGSKQGKTMRSMTATLEKGPSIGLLRPLHYLRSTGARQGLLAIRCRFSCCCWWSWLVSDSFPVGVIKLAQMHHGLGSVA